MLRVSVLLLLLANAGYAMWAQGMLAPWGLAPAQQSEPQRVRQQINPQAIRVLPADEVRRLEAALAPATAPQGKEPAAAPLTSQGTP